MPLLLVDALEPADAAALRAHLATGCPRCAAYLAEADATLAYLPFSLDPVSPPVSARQKLFDRVEIEEPKAPSARPHHLRMPVWVRRFAPVAVAACIAIIATVSFLRPMIDELKTKLATADQRNRSLTTQSLAKDQYIQLVKADELRLITMQGKAQPKAMGRAIWDGQRQVWRFFAKNLEPLGKREKYELWFITPYGRKVPAGIFSVDETGSAEMVVPPVPSEVGPIEAAMVTDEPHVGTFQPTGTVHLYGKVE